MKGLRIGCGAGYSGDRIDPAVELADRGRLDYLIFEGLAERTIALAQLDRSQHPEGGFDPLLLDRMRAVLPACRAHGTTVITNMGAANPTGAARAVGSLARSMGLHGLRVAAITGDDVLEAIKAHDGVITETGEPISALGDRLVSANAYTGVEAIVQAIALGADVIIAGRVADPSLFLAPQVHAFGWAADDWNRRGAGTLVGHLLECAGQVTGGYFADPVLKDVPDLAHLGFPIAEVAEDGTAVITKVPGSGGRVTRATCTEQLLYEIHDPAAYLTPDVVADFSGATLHPDGDDRVRVGGGRGRPRPLQLKVALGYRDGFIGEGQISYAGAGAVARGWLALDVVRTRLIERGIAPADIHGDLIGVSALHGEAIARLVPRTDPYEVRVRVAARAGTTALAQLIGREVEALYTNGPAGGGGATRSVREVLAVASTFVPRDGVTCNVAIDEVRA